jgi:hypothetical protein
MLFLFVKEALLLFSFGTGYLSHKNYYFICQTVPTYLGRYGTVPEPTYLPICTVSFAALEVLTLSADVKGLQIELGTSWVGTGKYNLLVKLRRGLTDLRRNLTWLRRTLIELRRTLIKQRHVQT